MTLNQWICKENANHILDRWDYEINELDPENITWKSHKYIWLKCDVNPFHKSEKYCVRDNVNGYINTKDSFKCVQCRSIAQWGLDNIGSDFIDKYWSIDNKDVNPFEIFAKSNYKIYINYLPNEGDGSYEIPCCRFVKRIVAQKDKVMKPFKSYERMKTSFAEHHIKNTDKNFLVNYWSKNNVIDPYLIGVNTRTHIFIRCQNNIEHLEYKLAANSFSRGSRCPYCSHHKIIECESIAHTHPRSIELWSDLNDTFPHEHFARSNQKFGGNVKITNTKII